MFTKETLKRYNENDMIIYNFIQNNKDLIPYLRIRELAEKTNVSTTSIIRFCKKSGFVGFSEMKNYFKFYKKEIESNVILNYS